MFIIEIFIIIFILSSIQRSLSSVSAWRELFYSFFSASFSSFSSGHFGGKLTFSLLASDNGGVDVASPLLVEGFLVELLHELIPGLSQELQEERGQPQEGEKGHLL